MWVTLVYLRTVQNIFAQKSIFSEIRDFEILTKISFFSENDEIDILDAIFSAKTPYMMLIMAILKEYNFLNHIIGEKKMAPILHRFFAFSEENISNQRTVPKFLFGYNDSHTSAVSKNDTMRLVTSWWFYIIILENRNFCFQCKNNSKFWRSATIWRKSNYMNDTTKSHIFTCWNKIFGEMGFIALFRPTNMT